MQLSHEQAHAIAREKGINAALYRLMQIVLVPLLRVLFRLHVEGASNVPTAGAAVIAPNHKSFFDSFFVAVALSRQIHGMGKSELFHGRRGRLLLALGAFPVKRGESDAQAMTTARLLLEQGELVTVFPEGTRVRDPAALGTPKRGAARLAIETGAPLIPVSITGTEKRRVPLPRRVQVSFGEAISVTDLEATPEVAGNLTDTIVWPQIEQEYRRLRARPGLIAAGLAAAGVAVAVQQHRKRR